MRNSVTSPGQLSGSIPVKLFSEISKKLTDSIARMPPPLSGSAPAKQLWSIPVKLLTEIEKWVTDSIACMPPSGSAPAKQL
eukprot:2376402-Amphidinium_carterae.1